MTSLEARTTLLSEEGGGRTASRTIALTEELSREVLRAHGASNRSLARHLHADLEAHGYLDGSGPGDR